MYEGPADIALPDGSLHPIPGATPEPPRESTRAERRRAEKAAGAPMRAFRQLAVAEETNEDGTELLGIRVVIPEANAYVVITDLDVIGRMAHQILSVAQRKLARSQLVAVHGG